MLILSRSTHESIIIGDDVMVTVVAVEGNRVRLGIRAPDDVNIDRTEVRERIVGERADPKHRVA